MKELYLLMEEEELNAQHSDNKTCMGDSWTQNTVCLAYSQCCPNHLFLCMFRDHFLPPSFALSTGAAEVIAWSLASVLSAVGQIGHPRAVTEGQMMDCQRQESN